MSRLRCSFAASLGIASVGILAVILLGVAITLRVMKAADRSRGATIHVAATHRPRAGISWPSPVPHTVVIEATGHDYSWRFRYPGPDQQLGTSDDFWVERVAHLPLDADVVVLVKSDDNVYAFAAPALQVKRIAVPELTYSVQFRANATGSFDLLMDPLCGARLFQNEPMGQLVVEPDRDFRGWLRQHATTGVRR